MDKGATHFTQIDSRWRDLLVFAPDLREKLQFLTEILHAIAKGDSCATAARTALADFTATARKAIRNPASHSNNDGTFYDYGCQICSIATMLRLLDIRIERKQATPENVLQKLREEMLCTLTGFSWDSGIDSVGVISNGKIRLVAYEDTLGILPARCKSLKDIPRNRIALVNVIGHEYLPRGRGDTAHYILVKGGQRKTRTQLVALDPESDEPIPLKTYKRLFVVRIYEKRK